MYIEDLLYTLYTSYTIKLGNFDRPMVQSLAAQIMIGKKITEKQGDLIVRILQKYKTQLNQNLNQDISQFLEKPNFKNSFRNVANTRSVTVVEHSLYKKAIKVEFPYNEEILARIKNERQKYSFSKCSYYDGDEKCWFFSLKESVIVTLSPLIKEFNFSTDEEITNYLSQIDHIRENIEKYLPMIIKHDKNYKIVNLPSFVNTVESENLTETLFAARKLGITVWDQTIEEEISQENFNPLVTKFLKNDPTSIFEFDSSTTPLISLAELVKNLLPCCVVIPGGTEFEKLLRSLEMFHSIGIENSQMSVLFRLQNKTNADFNQFIRENKLNSPVKENTQVVFLSQHVPKTILSPLKHFNSLLNFNYINVHYKLATMIKHQENVINILEKSTQRRFNFANL